MLDPIYMTRPVINTIKQVHPTTK